MKYREVSQTVILTCVYTNDSYIQDVSMVCKAEGGKSNLRIDMCMDQGLLYIGRYHGF